MKVVSSLKPLCPACYIVRRGKKLYMRCKENPRHKRRQGSFATLTMAKQTTGAFHVPVDGSEEHAFGGKSYDGFYLDSVKTDAASSNQINFVSGSSCSHCAKPLIFDMSARIKAKQDFMELVEENEHEE